jgi:hypothetical protein
VSSASWVRRWGRRALVAGAVAYALGAAATTPFTVAADVLTAVPIGLMAVLAVARWPGRPRPRPVRAGTHPYLPWLCLTAVVAAWELANYLAAGSRSAHPTLSSMADAIDRHYPAKALVFFGWLCLGAAVLRLGTQEGAS